MKSVTIEGRAIGADEPVYFVADIASNHDGDIERAKDLIHIAAEAGADAAKFQNFKAPKIVSDRGFRSLGAQASHQKTWAKSVYEVYEDASVPDEWTPILHAECARAGIHYATSPYDLDSVDTAAPYTAFFKIGSGDITWPAICEHMARKGKPIFLATGASAIDEVASAVDSLSRVAQSLVLMQCNTNYTGSRENFSCINLRVLETFASMWPDLVLGLSDHTPGCATVLGAVALGARVIEKHFTDDRRRTGPDHSFSMDPASWREMVDRTRELELALGDGVKRVEKNECETVVLQRRCLRASRDIAAGETISRGDLEPLRPAPHGSLSPSRLEMLVGARVVRPLARGEHITAEHIEGGAN